MTDTSNPFAGLSMSGLLQDDSKSMPQSMRQKIALAMMLKKQAYPKTFGEGLSSIGDSISEAMMMRQMGREAADVEKTNRAVEEGILGPPGGVTSPPAAVGPSPVQAASIASGAPPAVPLPPDQQQSYEPGAPVRMSTPEQLADFRGQRPLPTFRPPQGTVGRAPVGDETGPPPQAMPSPMPPPGAPPPGLPPQALQRPPVADFGQKPVLAPTPPPGAPVMAKGPDPASLPMAPPDDPRRAIALAMMKQGQTGQPPASSFSGAPQPPPISPPAAPPPVAQPDALAAAPPTPIIKQAPQDPTTQIQKAPTYAPDYVPPMRPERAPPPTLTPLMGKIQDAIRNAAPGDREDLAARFKVPYENEQAKVKQAHDIYQSQLTEDRAHNAQVEQLRSTAAQRGIAAAETKQKMDKTQQEIDVLKRTGGLGNEALLAPVVKSQERVAGVPGATQSLRNARLQLEQGIFTGAGAEQKLAMAKSKETLASLFGVDANDPKIANTEAFRATIMPLVAQARSATSGNANISDADIKLAMSAVGGDITLDAKTFPRVLDALERINLGLAIGHQGRVSAAAGGNETAAQALQGAYGLPMEDIIPPRFIQRLKEHPETAGDFDRTFKTPGLSRKILGQ